MVLPATHVTPGTPVPRGTGGSAGEADCTPGSPPALSLVASSDTVSPSTPSVHLVEVSRISPSSQQPRRTFNEEALAELAQSIGQVGLLQPLVCRRVDTGTSTGEEWELVAGERRWRACQIVGLDLVPVVEYLNSAEDHTLTLAAAVIENLQRQDLNAIELALAYQQLSRDGLTSQDVGQLVGKSADHVRAHLGLLRLPEGVQRSLMAGVLSFGQARPLCALEDPADAEALAVRITRENLTVRQIDEVLATGSFARSSHSQRKRGPSRPRTRRFLELEECLELTLETRVRVEGSSRGGWVKVMFADEEDLARLRSLMARGTGE